MPALLLGSLSAVADTSELQRAAFNRAFEVHDLGWSWDRDTYRTMLASSGGRDRLAEYARSRGETVDAQAVHETKSALFRQSLGSADLSPRPGVVDTITVAKDRGWKVGLVTTTSGANVTALLESLAPELRAEDFDVVVDAGSVDAPKPAPDAYTFAAGALAVSPADCVAVEDNVGGVSAARAAGVPCVAFPNANTAAHDFDGVRVVDHLDLDDLTS